MKNKIINLLRTNLAWINRKLNLQIRQSRIDFLVDNGWLVMGRHSYGNPEIHLYRGSEAKVIIGNFTSISPDVIFITGGIHPSHWISTYPFRALWHLNRAFEDGLPYNKGDIQVGSDIWIGTDAMILSGVHIGDGAIVAARSVITKDVPPYAIVGGVPAKVIKFRFDQDVIAQLLEIQWWNWSDEKIKEAINLLSSPDITAFLTKYSKHQEIF